MRHIPVLSTFILVVISCSLDAQNAYLISDSSKFVRAVIVDAGDVLNAKFCRRVLDGNIIQYSPFEVKEYGLNDGRVYVSKDIKLNGPSRRVFLERLVSDTTSLYYFKDEDIETYFIENKKAGFVELPHRSLDKAELAYRHILSGLMSDCHEVDDALKVVIYQKKSMALLTKRYNACVNKPFPFFKYGFYAGVGFSTLDYISGVGNAFFKQENIYFKNADFKYDNGFIFGVFIDQPLASTDFSIHPEIYFTKNDYSSKYEMDGAQIEVFINTQSINFPVLFRYTFPIAKARPYINAGLIYAYQFKQEFDSYATPNEQGEQPAPVVINQLGLTAGCGAQIDLASRLRLYLDFRYNYLYGLRVSGQESYLKSEFQISSGISF